MNVDRSLFGLEGFAPGVLLLATLEITTCVLVVCILHLAVKRTREIFEEQRWSFLFPSHAFHLILPHTLSI